MPRNSKKTEEQTPKVETPSVTVAPTEAPKAAPEAPEVPAAPAEPEAPAQQETPEPKETPKVETPAPAPQEPAIPAVAPTAPKVKKVKVILTVDIDSFINGERYQYPAKKMIEVPEDVAQILVYGNKGYRM